MIVDDGRLRWKTTSGSEENSHQPVSRLLNVQAGYHTCRYMMAQRLLLLSKPRGRINNTVSIRKTKKKRKRTKNALILHRIPLLIPVLFSFDLRFLFNKPIDKGPEKIDIRFQGGLFIVCFSPRQQVIPLPNQRAPSAYRVPSPHRSHSPSPTHQSPSTIPSPSAPP